MSLLGTRDAGPRVLQTLGDVERYLLDDLPPMSAGVMSGDGVGRRRAARLLAGLGDPQDGVRSVHVAGTAGKGSVASYLASILTAHGWRVGTHLSPHAHHVAERFQVDGLPAAPRALASAAAEVRDAAARLATEPDGPPSMFEVCTAVAATLFVRVGVDYAVVETGLGGTHDATNTITRPDKLAVVTAIGLDHTDVLGATPAQIAAHKAGILPSRGRAVAVRSGPPADDVVAAEAAVRDCDLLQLSPAELAGALRADLRPALPGPHQRVNAGLAVRAATLLAERDGWTIDGRLVAQGLMTTRLPGRFERGRYRGHRVVLDGAHNPMKAAALLAAVREAFPGRRPVWVVAVREDKDVVGVLRVVERWAASIILTEFGSAEGYAAAPGEEVYRRARAAGVGSLSRRADLRTALDDAVRASGGTEPTVPVVVTGSFHTVAEAGRLVDRG